MMLVFSLMVAITMSQATEVPCRQRLDVISIYAWPLLSTRFNPDLLTETDLVAIDHEMYSAHAAILHTGCKTYLATNISSFNLNGSDMNTTRELRELQGHVVRDVQFGSGFAAILTADGTVWTAGHGSFGRLGHHGTQNVPVFHQVGGLPSVRAIALGYSNSVALTLDDQLFSWGYNSRNRSLGYSTDSHVNPTPKQIPLSQAGSPPKSICCGVTSCAVLMEDSTVLTWGRARYIGRNDSETIPAAVEGIPAGQTITKIACGSGHTLALSSSGSLYGWGGNWCGQLLNATSLAPYSTQLHVEDNRVLDVVAGDDITVVRTDAGLKYFGEIGWEAFRTPQTVGRFVFARDAMAEKYYPAQSTHGSVKLGCMASRQERCEDASSEERHP